MNITVVPDTNLELVVQEFNLGTLKTNAIALRDQVKAQLAGYNADNYTEDNIQQAKDDKATLNKFAEKLNASRLERERAWMQPFDENFKSIVNETCTLIKTASGAIDAIVKTVEQKAKDAKREAIQAMFNAKTSPYFTLDRIFNPAWLNKGAKLKDIGDEIQARIDKVASDLKIIEDMGEQDAREHYLNTLDLASAMAEATRIKENRKRLEELAPSVAPAPVVKAPEEVRCSNTVPGPTLAIQDYVLMLKCTPERFKQLEDFLGYRGISYERMA